MRRDEESPPVSRPHLDLTGVRLDADASTLTITYELAGPVPTRVADDDFILFVVTTFVGDQSGYQLGAKLIGSEWTVFVFDLRGARQTNLNGDPEINGTSLTVHFPVAAVERLTDGFRWYARTEAGGWPQVGDWAPESEEGGQPVGGELSTFP
ncbi:MAG: hypothetical protein AB7R89_03565 [Dehalococcoidia bacterium]